MTIVQIGFHTLGEKNLNCKVFWKINCQKLKMKTDCNNWSWKFFRNSISDNESFMFWHSIVKIFTQNFNPLRRNRNLQKWPINVNKLVLYILIRGCSCGIPRKICTICRFFRNGVFSCGEVSNRFQKRVKIYSFKHRTVTHKCYIWVEIFYI